MSRIAILSILCFLSTELTGMQPADVVEMASAGASEPAEAPAAIQLAVDEPRNEGRDWAQPVYPTFCDSYNYHCCWCCNGQAQRGMHYVIALNRLASTPARAQVHRELLQVLQERHDRVQGDYRCNFCMGAFSLPISVGAIVCSIIAMVS